MTGKLIHNIPMTNNTVEGNCSSIAFQNGAEKQAIGVLLQKQGYHTSFAGKYLNMYGFPNVGGTAHVPPGWSDWYGLVGNSRYYGQTMSANGVAEHHGNQYSSDYLTDLLKNHTLEVMRSALQASQPFFSIVAPPACHDPTEPAPKYANSWAGRKAPRTPNYGNSNEDKNWLVKTEGGQMSPDFQAVSDWQFARRLDTLRSVDDMVEAFVCLLEQHNALNNTFIAYSADNGFHHGASHKRKKRRMHTCMHYNDSHLCFCLPTLGQFGLLKDKRMPYETDIRLPLFIRGPGLPANASSDSIVSMVDFAPTFLAMAGAANAIPDDMDGQNILPLLQSVNSQNLVVDKQAANSKLMRSGISPGGRTILVEFHGEAQATGPGGVCNGAGAHTWGPGIAAYIEGPEMTQTPPVFTGKTVCSVQDASNNTYECLRTINASEDTTFCRYEYGFEEFYINSGPNGDMWQRRNKVGALSSTHHAAYSELLERMTTCRGAECVVIYS